MVSQKLRNMTSQESDSAYDPTRLHFLVCVHEVSECVCVWQLHSTFLFVCFLMIFDGQQIQADVTFGLQKFEQLCM